MTDVLAWLIGISLVLFVAITIAYFIYLVVDFVACMIDLIREQPKDKTRSQEEDSQ